MAPLLLSSTVQVRPMRPSLRNQCPSWKRSTVSNGIKTRQMLVWSPFDNKYVIPRSGDLLCSGYQALSSMPHVVTGLVVPGCLLLANVTYWYCGCHLRGVHPSRLRAAWLLSSRSRRRFCVGSLRTA